MAHTRCTNKRGGPQPGPIIAPVRPIRQNASEGLGVGEGRAGRGGVGLHLTTRLVERFRPSRRPRLQKRGFQYQPIFLNASKVAEPYSVGRGGESGRVGCLRADGRSGVRLGGDAELDGGAAAVIERVGLAEVAPLLAHTGSQDWSEPQHAADAHHCGKREPDHLARRKTERALHTARMQPGRGARRYVRVGEAVPRQERDGAVS